MLGNRCFREETREKSARQKSAPPWVGRHPGITECSSNVLVVPGGRMAAREDPAVAEGLSQQGRVLHGQFIVPLGMKCMVVSK